MLRKREAITLPPVQRKNFAKGTSWSTRWAKARQSHTVIQDVTCKKKGMERLKEWLCTGNSKARWTRQVMVQSTRHELYWGLQLDPMTYTGLEQQGNWKEKDRGSLYCIYMHLHIFNPVKYNVFRNALCVCTYVFMCVQVYFPSSSVSHRLNSM